MATPRKRILIVDRDTGCYRTLSRWFQEAGCEAIHSTSGAEAIALTSQRNPDVLLMDMHPRVLNAFDVLRILKGFGDTASIPVVLMSDEADEGLLRSASEASGASGFLAKPIDRAVLFSAVQAALNVAAPTKPNPWIIRRGEIVIDLRRKTVSANGNRISLGPRRFAVLTALARTKDGLPNSVLRGMVWGNDSEPINTVVKTVHRLRSDLLAALGIDLIVPISGGYRFH